MKSPMIRTWAQIALAAGLALVSLTSWGDGYQEASQLFKQGKQAAALEKIETVLAVNPKDARARFLKGLILTEQNKSQEAIKVFTALTEDYPELPEPYNNLAVLYAAQGQYEQARKALEMAIRTHPSYAIAHENLGDVYAKMASEAYDKALQLDRGNKTAQTKLALIKELFSSSVPSPKPSRTEAPEPAAPQVSAPAAAPAAQKPSAANSTREVVAAVEDWARAWSKKDVDAYLSFYSPEFETPGGQSREAWAAARRNRLEKPKSIHVSIDAPKVSFDGDDRAVVTFRQNYRSDALKSSGAKTLTLVKRSDRWLIVQEQIDR